MPQSLLLPRKKYLKLERFSSIYKESPFNDASLVEGFLADDIAGNDGDAVGTWAGRVAVSATQATADSKPLLKKNIVNSKAVVRLDGINDSLSAPLAASQPNTFIAVVKLANPAAEGYLVDFTGVEQQLYANGSYLGKWIMTAGTQLEGGALSANWAIVTANFNGASSKQYIDGVPTASGNAGTGGGTALVIGKDFLGGNPLGADIACLLFFNVTLSAAKLNAYHGWLADYYGISAKCGINANIWTVTDTGGYSSVATPTGLSIAGGPGNHTDMALVTVKPILRKAGLTLEAKVKAAATNTAGPYVGFLNAAAAGSANWEHLLDLTTDGVVRVDLSGPTQYPSIPTYQADAWKYLRIVLKATGALYYASDDGITWSLVWVDDTLSAATLYAQVHNWNATAAVRSFKVYQSVPKPPVVSDTFTRADSALTLGSAETGQTWTAVVGTWGISSNKAYSASDAGNERATINPGVANFILDCTISGTLNSGSNYRVPCPIFHYNGEAEYLMFEMLAGTVTLYKQDSGWTSLVSAALATADATDYSVRVVSIGNDIKIYVDGTLRLSHTLAAGNTKFAAYTTAGLMVEKDGAPATAARFDNFKVQA